MLLPLSPLLSRAKSGFILIVTHRVCGGVNIDLDGNISGERSRMPSTWQTLVHTVVDLPC